jgi:hypothetical protein
MEDYKCRERDSLYLLKTLYMKYVRALKVFQQCPFVLLLKVGKDRVKCWEVNTNGGRLADFSMQHESVSKFLCKFRRHSCLFMLLLDPLSIW